MQTMSTYQKSHTILFSGALATPFLKEDPVINSFINFTKLFLYYFGLISAGEFFVEV